MATLCYFQKAQFWSDTKAACHVSWQEWNGKNVKKRIQDERSAYYIHYCLKDWGS